MQVKRNKLFNRQGENRVNQYLLCIGYTHDVQFGGERERERELLVISSLLQGLEGLA